MEPALKKPTVYRSRWPGGSPVVVRCSTAGNIRIATSHYARTISTSDTEGCLFSVSEARYLAPRWEKNPLPSVVESDNLTLATVFPISTKQLTNERMRKLLAEYNKDDVFDKAFLGTVIFNNYLNPGENSERLVSKNARRFLEGHGMEYFFFTTLPELLPGPHVIVNQELREVWKLVDDSYETCMVSLKPKQDLHGAFTSLSIMGQHNHVLSFAIPSRLKSRIQHSSKTEDSPLEGLRILVKDNIHLEGIKTSVGNRAFYDTYPPQKETARCVQELRNKGAVVLGKTKMTSFGNWEEPTEYVDYPAPWNPRADRYQSPGGSSSGSASAIAAYDWLDAAIGTDTWGSVTRPSHWCGCFGLRPSIEAISTDGIEPCVQSWDVPGILARDLETCQKVAENWLNFDKFANIPESFSSIIWPTDFWKIIEPKQRVQAKAFARSMAYILNVRLEEISFEENWEISPPVDDEPSLPNFINATMSGLEYEAYHKSEGFRSRYRELFGHAPFTSTQNEILWSYGKHTTRKERNQSFERIETYRQWFQQTVWTGSNANPIIVMPIEAANPRYRDEFPKFERPPQLGIGPLALGPVMKAPVLAVPFAEMPYTSRVTQRVEKLPFAVALMGTPGADMELIKTTMFILGCLNKPTALSTGRTMWRDQEK